jgi:cell wall-associated NlpC family hydrolase
MSAKPGGFDPRLVPARPDLAAAHLKGRVTAARFVEGTVKRVIAATAPMRRTPAHDLPVDTEALHGERVVVYETTEEGWAWGQLELDQYVGWISAAALGDPGAAPNHRVAALRTFVFPGPDVKLPPLATLSFGSRLAIVRAEHTFALTDKGGYIAARHLAPVDRIEPDFVATARRFTAVPYLWGGRTSLGLDCSGLVQISLQAAGIACPRDSDMQAQFGKPVSFSDDLAALRRGDLVCWQGHIGIVAEPGRLLHANAFHMEVAEEPLAQAIARIRQSGLEVTTVRRLD